ncbi:hypothetical protein [Clostridium sp. YIM B02555]|uniref:hypothetical protein n=1 Tax=Clostridium sp. YIM B02555 TaxID=2911968 RepID=UPI001EEE2A27|nr:hypothetical protein [Clostridium sp. YIM B02555]
MKKIVLTVIAVSMLLTNVAFASTSTEKANVKNSTISSVTQNNMYHLDSTDPH